MKLERVHEGPWCPKHGCVSRVHFLWSFLLWFLAMNRLTEKGFECVQGYHGTAILR